MNLDGLIKHYDNLIDYYSSNDYIVSDEGISQLPASMDNSLEHLKDIQNTLSPEKLEKFNQFFDRIIKLNEGLKSYHQDTEKINRAQLGKLAAIFFKLVKDMHGYADPITPPPPLIASRFSRALDQLSQLKKELLAQAPAQGIDYNALFAQLSTATDATEEIEHHLIDLVKEEKIVDLLAKANPSWLKHMHFCLMKIEKKIGQDENLKTIKRKNPDYVTKKINTLYYLRHYVNNSSTFPNREEFLSRINRSLNTLYSKPLTAPLESLSETVPTSFISFSEIDVKKYRNQLHSKFFNWTLLKKHFSQILEGVPAKATEENLKLFDAYKALLQNIEEQFVELDKNMTNPAEFTRISDGIIKDLKRVPTLYDPLSKALNG